MGLVGQVLKTAMLMCLQSLAGVYGNPPPQFVYGALEAGGQLGTWLHDFDGWSGVDGDGVPSGASTTAIGVYPLAPQPLQVPMGTNHHIFKAFCVPMAMLDTDHHELALKLHWLIFPMLFCPVYEIGAAGKSLSPTAAVKAWSTDS